MLRHFSVNFCVKYKYSFKRLEKNNLKLQHVGASTSFSAIKAYRFGVQLK